MRTLAISLLALLGAANVSQACNRVGFAYSYGLVAPYTVVVPTYAYYMTAPVALPAPVPTVQAPPVQAPAPCPAPVSLAAPSYDPAAVVGLLAVPYGGYGFNSFFVANHYRSFHRTFARVGFRGVNVAVGPRRVVQKQVIRQGPRQTVQKTVTRARR